MAYRPASVETPDFPLMVLFYPLDGKKDLRVTLLGRLPDEEGDGGKFHAMLLAEGTVANDFYSQ